MVKAKITKSKFSRLTVYEQKNYIHTLTQGKVIVKPNNKGKFTKHALQSLAKSIQDEYCLFQKSFTKSNLLRREADSLYYAMKDVINLYDSRFNPPFTEHDQKKKEEIFKIDSPKTCFVTGVKAGIGVGDHLFEVRGYNQQTGMYGSNSKWNLIPVTASKNCGYKRFKLKDGSIKDIGYQRLTQKELRECSHEQRVIYKKVMAWKEYVKSRGAMICFEISNDVEARVYHMIHTMYDTAHTTQQCLFDDVLNGVISL